MTVTRLVTFVELDGFETDHQLSVSARLEAELADGRRVVLLDDRGWGETTSAPDLWARLTGEAIAATARTVVGPDEPWDGRSYGDAARAYWQTLTGTLAAAGIEARGDDLATLPHDVVLGEQLRARIS